MKAFSRAQAQEQFIMSGGGSLRDHTQFYTVKWTHVQGLPFIYLRIFQSFRCVNTFKAEINASALKIRGQKFNWCSTAAFVSCTIKESNWKRSEDLCVNIGTWCLSTYPKKCHPCVFETVYTSMSWPDMQTLHGFVFWREFWGMNVFMNMVQLWPVVLLEFSPSRLM